MTESEINAFLSVIKNGTLSGAAADLYLSQPALSRRLASLEEELGCTLIVRRKGQRYIELTREGKAFISLAQRWQSLLSESSSLASAAATPALRMGCVGSVCNILLQPVFQQFLLQYPECRLNVFQHHSTECYEHLEDNTLDFALISDDAFSKSVETTPAFKSHFYLLSRAYYGTAPINPADLDPRQEIRIPWTPEYDLWHDYWFGPTAKAHIVLDQMPLLEYFITSTTGWALAPAYVARLLHERTGVAIRTLTQPPPDEIIYYLQPKHTEHVNSYNSKFLLLLKELLAAQHPELTLLL